MAREEEICTKISDSVKMAGFLEKKGKMKIVSAWKKYWFVLEERLLLYYRSQVEYINLSPCRGSLNMGLVTTVRPGPSAGPCVIHVITRTQVVQLRAKNRAMQEEWLQALLDSMSLPLFNKTLKTTLISDLHCHRYSMDNIPLQERLRKGESERSQRAQQAFDGRKEPADGLFGGSLETVIWSKKYSSARSLSRSASRGKMPEKISGWEEESGASAPLVEDEANGWSAGGGIEEAEDSGEEALRDEAAEGAARTKPESQLERIRNAMRKTREKAFGSKSESEVKSKRRQSFLQKMFRRTYRVQTGRGRRDDESDVDDPLYDAVKASSRAQTESPVLCASDSSEEAKVGDSPDQSEEEAEEVPVADAAESVTLAEVRQRPVFGSRSILTAQAMSELKTKLKSRESVGSEGEAPELPPRGRQSRPRSPRADALVGGAAVPGRAQSQPREAPAAQPPDDDLAALLEQLTEMTSTTLAAPSSGCVTSAVDDARTNRPRAERRLSDPDYDVPRPHKPANLCISGEGGRPQQPPPPQAGEQEGQCEEEQEKENEEEEELHRRIPTRSTADSSDTSLSFQSIEPDSLESADKKSLSL